MTIPDDIIERFSLVDSYQQINNSFIYNLRIFRIDIVGFWDWHAMECELDGRPSEFILFYNTETKQYIKTPLEMLQQVKTFPDLLTLLS